MSNSNGTISETAVNLKSDVYSVLGMSSVSGVYPLSNATLSSKLNHYARFRPGDWRVDTSNNLYYRQPAGGSGDPYMLGDFRLYNHHAYAPYVANPVMNEKLAADQAGQTKTITTSLYMGECDWFGEEETRIWGKNASLSSMTQVFMVCSSYNSYGHAVSNSVVNKADLEHNGYYYNANFSAAMYIADGAQYVFKFALGYGGTPKAYFLNLTQTFNISVVSNPHYLIEIPESALTALWKALDIYDSSSSTTVYRADAYNNEGTFSGTTTVNHSGVSFRIELTDHRIFALTTSKWQVKYEVYYYDSSDNYVGKSSGTTAITATDGAIDSTTLGRNYTFTGLTMPSSVAGYLYRIRIVSFTNTVKTYQIQ